MFLLVLSLALDHDALPSFPTRRSSDLDLLDGTIGEELVKVHKSYLNLISELKETEGVNGFSHITGGGIVGNTKRILPDGLSLDISWDTWERPAIFNLIQQAGNVPEEDMRDTFNLGVGLIAVVSESALSEVQEICDRLGEEVIDIGRVV